MRLEADRCLFCGGDVVGPEHWRQCDGRQGGIEAEERPAVLDDAEAERVTEIGIARSVINLAEERMDLYVGLIEAVARRLERFTSDDVWVLADREGITLTGMRTSALGSAFRVLARAGMIVLTDEYVESRRPANHRRPLRVWRSLLTRGASRE